MLLATLLTYLNCVLEICRKNFNIETVNYLSGQLLRSETIELSVHTSYITQCATSEMLLSLGLSPWNHTKMICLK